MTLPPRGLMGEAKYEKKTTFSKMSSLLLHTCYKIEMPGSDVNEDFYKNCEINAPGSGNKP